MQFVQQIHPVTGIIQGLNEGRGFIFPSEVRTKCDGAITITLLYNSYGSSNGGLHAGTDGRGDLFLSEARTKRGGAVRTMSISIPNMQFIQLVKCRLAMTRGLRDEVIYFFQVSEIHIERGGAIKIMSMSIP